MTTTATYNKSAWLGNFPAHWQVLRIKNIFSEIEDRSTSGNEELLSVSHYTGITLKRDSLENEDDFISNAETLEGYKRVAKGDLVINIMLAWNGSLGISPFDGITSPAYCVYRTKENNNPEYFGYLFATNLLKTEFRKKSTGIIDSRLRLYSDKFFSIFSVVPPVEEQNQIVEYIKTQSQKINHFIAKKQQFIALLKEQRQSVINDAVTKGINKNVKLTDSGIKWLGNIPAHWEVKRIKNISSVISKGTTPSTMGADTIENGNIRFLKAENLYTNEVSLFPEFFIDEKTDQMLFRSRLKENDILLVIAGATIGRIGIVKKECIPANTNQAVCFIRPDNIEPEYLLIWMQCSYFYNVLWFNANQSAQPNIAMGKISNFNVAYPPLSEQTQIVNHIKTETATIDTAVAKTEREIELIKEYKEAMIAEAVMGKVNFNKQANK